LTEITRYGSQTFIVMLDKQKCVTSTKILNWNYLKLKKWLTVTFLSSWYLIKYKPTKCTFSKITF
jgi:hypothetical protein